MKQETATGSDAAGFLTGEICENEINICCPICGGDYTHISQVGTLRGSDEHEAKGAYPGTQTVGNVEMRRDALQVLFDCEICHGTFEFRIQQHKGVNYLSFVFEDKGGA
jgi:hypothetical protein